MAPPVLVIFIQFHIITPLCNKINPFFKFFCGIGRLPAFSRQSALSFPEYTRPADAFRAAFRLSRPKFLHKEIAVVKTTRVEKVGKWQKGVASFYVNQNRISPVSRGCGKLLWKNLWRMWKTIGFQQVFRFFAALPGMWKSLHTGLHNIGYNPVTAALRHREPEDVSIRKSTKLFASLEKMLSKTVRSPSSEKFFCEKSPKSFLVSYFPGWKYFS